MSEMLVHLLIQAAITFESYRGSWIYLAIKDYTLQLCGLEDLARFQILKISL